MIARIFLQSLLLLALAAVAGAVVYRFHPNRPELYLTRDLA